jgi:hypothetical protein
MKENFIVETNDYSKFGFFPYNRQTDLAKIDKISKSIEEHGFLVPILVNQDFLIIDGQNRLQAAKNINKALTYIQISLDYDKAPFVISSLNRSSSIWRIEDYFNMWENLGREDFIRARNFMKHNKIKFSEFERVVFYNGSSREVMKKGNPWFSELKQKETQDFFNKFFSILNFNSRTKEFSDDKNFRFAVIKLLVNKSYNHKRFMEKLKNHSSFIVECKSSFSYSVILEDIYNVGLRKKGGKLIKVKR